MSKANKTSSKATPGAASSRDTHTMESIFGTSSNDNTPVKSYVPQEESPMEKAVPAHESASGKGSCSKLHYYFIYSYIGNFVFIGMKKQSGWLGMVIAEKKAAVASSPGKSSGPLTIAVLFDDCHDADKGTE